jgi:uncharacterized membrane protein
MNWGFILALFLTIVPFIELRGGLPLAILYSPEIGLSIFFIFIIIILLNILLIFLIFFFLDYIHQILLRNFTYSQLFNHYINKTQKKVDKFKKRYNRLGFWSMVLFVGIPLPGTGVYTACLIVWILGLERKRNIFAISLGVLIAGLIVLSGTLGILKIF